MVGALCATAMSQQAAEFSSYYSGNRYDFRLTHQQLLNTPAWLEDEPNPPLSPRTAQSAALSYLRTLVDNATAWRLEEIKLVPVPERWSTSFLTPHRPVTAKTAWLHPSASLLRWTETPLHRLCPHGNRLRLLQMSEIGILRQLSELHSERVSLLCCFAGDVEHSIKWKVPDAQVLRPVHWSGHDAGFFGLQCSKEQETIQIQIPPGSLGERRCALALRPRRWQHSLGRIYSQPSANCDLAMEQGCVTFRLHRGHRAKLSKPSVWTIAIVSI